MFLSVIRPSVIANWHSEVRLVPSTGTGRWGAISLNVYISGDSSQVIEKEISKVAKLARG